MGNFGQITLIIGAMALLVTLQLAINSSIIRAFTLTLDNEATIDAISIGQAMVDEIMTKEFDTKTDSAKIYNVADLTPYASFGSDGGETVSAYEREPFQSAVRFNDFDDYQGYTRIVVSPRLGDFIVRDSVYYVQQSNPDLISAANTWYKKVIVKVTHPNLLNPVIVKSLTVYRRFL